MLKTEEIVIEKEILEKTRPIIPKKLWAILRDKINSLITKKVDTPEDIDEFKLLFDDLYRYLRKESTRGKLISKIYQYISLKPVFTPGMMLNLLELDRKLVYSVIEFLYFMDVIEVIETLPVGGRKVRIWKIDIDNDKHQYLHDRIRKYYDIKANYDKKVLYEHKSDKEKGRPKTDTEIKQKAVEKAKERAAKKITEKTIVEPVKKRLTFIESLQQKKTGPAYWVCCNKSPHSVTLEYCPYCGEYKSKERIDLYYQQIDTKIAELMKKEQHKLLAEGS